MPLLLQFIFRQIFALGLSVLAFFGIHPDVEIPTAEEAKIQTEERREEAMALIVNNTRDPHLPEDDTHTSLIPIEIPLPKNNILEEAGNSTQPDANKTDPPIVPSVPTQSNPPIEFPQIELPTIPPVEVVETEIVTELPQRDPDITEANSIANAVVNIVCVRRNGNKIHLTTGSGVIISPRGVVLTNTHVAQFFLLEEAGYECSLRRENIPLYGFEAEPLYISEKWIEDNFLLISHPSPMGTGEDDYALLYITENTNPALTLPSRFAYIEPNVRSGAASIGNQVTVAGYPGEQSGIFDLDSNAALKTDQTSIRDVFTFNRTSVDVFATGDTDVAHRGSSGGGVFEDGALIGLIVTTNPGSASGKQIINALTLDYVNRDIRNETGGAIASFLTGDLADRAADFRRTVAPRLTELLLRNL